MRMLGPINTGAASGGAGVATANATTTPMLTGYVAAIGVVYNDSPPATTDVTVATSGTNGPAVTLLTLTNANTNGWFYPHVLKDDTAGADITGDYTRIPIADTVKVTIAQANNGDSADVYLLVEV